MNLGFTAAYGSLCALATSLVLVHGAALAQPTGNPKGTPSPPLSDSQKAPAGSSGSAAPGTSSGKLEAGSGPATARMQSSRSPGSGTAGGLPKRNAADGGGNGTTTPATRHSVTPAKP